MVLGSTPNFKLGTFDHSVIYPLAIRFVLTQ
jgi:hypothetical protein